MKGMAAEILVIAMLSFFGCASDKGLYRWGNYDKNLYKYYKNPEKGVDLREELASVIVESEERDQRVAPGLYAEIAYLLLEDGQNQEAEKYFEKEKEVWPESSTLMDRLIGASQTGGDSARREVSN